MAFVSTSPSTSSPTNGHHNYASQPQQSTSMPAIPQQRPRHISRHQWTSSLSRDLHNFVIQLLPTTEEMAVKEDVRKLLERLIHTLEPESRLLSFGSTANGFSLRNSDMDLCCLIDSSQPPLSASDLVTMVGDLLERETKFQVKTLPHARIPIVKLSLDPSPGLPYGISCDIGFENRLALENTRLLMSYASIDPLRVRTLVIFLKVWSKRRKINSPYSGTLSSYGYVLLVIFFLVHVKNPPVLPNLQQMPPLRPISHEDTHIGEHNIWFFDDIELLKERWQSSNTENVGELLIDFFKYYSRDYTYNTGVASIKAGLVKKSTKGWLSEFKDGRYHDDRNRFCIEDPFETDYNVARCVTKDGLYTIRGEFMRASRILAARPERTIVALAQLCEEREDEFVRPLAPQPFVPPRLASIPTQTPYTVNSSALRPSNSASEATTILEDVETPSATTPPEVSLPQDTEPPEHMAPKRGKWTSPPPPDDPEHNTYESRLGLSITLATSSTTARQPDRSEASSSSSEILSDEDAHDRADLESVGSFTSMDGNTTSQSQQLPAKRPLSFFATEDEPGWLVINTPKATNEPLSVSRGRAPLRFGFGEPSTTPTPTLKSHPRQVVEGVGIPIPDSPRRSMSGPPGPVPRWSSMPHSMPLPPSPPTRRTAAVANPSSPTDENTIEMPHGGYPGGGIQFGSVRTPFPLYQHQASPPNVHPSYITTAPSHAFTAHHPAGVTTSIPSPFPMDISRHSWHQHQHTGSSQGSSAASSPVISPSSSRRTTKLSGAGSSATPTPASMRRGHSPVSSPVAAVSPSSSVNLNAQRGSPSSQGPGRSPVHEGSSPSSPPSGGPTPAEESLSLSMGSLQLTASAESLR